jgi:hypothetical protein
MVEFSHRERDALLAEILGDVGLLLKSVDLLKDILPHQTKETAQRLTEIIGLIDKAGDAYITKKDASLTAHRIQLDNDLIEANLEFKRNLAELISGYEAVIKTKCTEPVLKMLNSVQRSQHSLLKKATLIALTSLFSGAIGGGSMYFAATHWTTPKKERDELAQEVEQLQQTLAKAKTWGVTFVEDKNGRFVVLPRGTKTENPWEIKDSKQKAIKLE